MTTLLQSTQNTTVASHEAGMVVTNSAFGMPIRIEVLRAGSWEFVNSYNRIDHAQAKISELRKKNRAWTYRLIRLSAVVVE